MSYEEMGDARRWINDNYLWVAAGSIIALQLAAIVFCVIMMGRG